MTKTCAGGRVGSRILPLENKCIRIHTRIVALQKAMRKIEKKSASNLAWRGLLNSAVKGMNDALKDLETRLKHIELELNEFLVLLMALALPFSLMLNGCASLKETGKKVWGSSMEHLEAKRAEGLSETFALTLDEAFSRAELAITKSGAEVYLKDEARGYMAAQKFFGHVDTTQAGIFFTQLSDGTTKVEVSSLSPYLVEDVAAMVFDALKGPAAPRAIPMSAGVPLAAEGEE